MVGGNMSPETKNKVKEKMGSRKFWFAVWGAVIASYIIIRSIETKWEASWMTAALALLIGIVTAYVAIGAAKKKKEGE